MRTSGYFWFKYSLVVILFILLFFLPMMSNMKVGPWLLLFLGARFIAEPVQIYWLTKKGKFIDLTYLTKRNKLNVVVNIGTITTVIILYVVLFYHLFTVGILTIQVLTILTVFIVIDVGYDFFTYYRLKQKKEIDRS
jgi:hypothetical protein